MFTTPPRHGPTGTGFTNETTKIRAEWLNYVGGAFPNALDAIGGGYYQLVGADLRLSSNTRGFILNFPDPSYKIELRGHVLLGTSNDANYPTGQGSVVIASDCSLSGDDARFRERPVAVGTDGDATLDLTADTVRTPNTLTNALTTWALPRTAALQGGECIRIVCRGNYSGKTLRITSEGDQTTLCDIDGGVYCVVEFRFDATVALAGDGLGAWFVASPQQTGLTLVNPYPII